MVPIKIIVLDYVSEYGGAQTVSNNHIQDMVKDETNQWYIITNQRIKTTSRHVTYHCVPWVKHSLLHRLWFEMRVLPRIVRQYQPDVVLSLQNLGARVGRIPQVLFVHQALVFQKHQNHYLDGALTQLKFKLLRWKLKRDVKKAALVIVQTNYMQTLIAPYNTHVHHILPCLYSDEPQQHQVSHDFIYPTNAQKYKRLDLVLAIARQIKKMHYPSKILLTLTGNENEYVKEFGYYCVHEHLPVKFIGRQSAEKMAILYQTHHLLFTSEVESLGLPLIEAMHYGCRILGYETVTTKEVVSDYPYQYLFNEKNITDVLATFYTTVDSESEGQHVAGTSIVTLLKTQQIISS